MSRHRLKLNVFYLIALLLLIVTFIQAQAMQTYQVEDARFYQAKVESEHSGFSGSGYVNFDNNTGSYIEFTVFMAETDTQTVYIRYANGAGSARTMQVQADSVALENRPEFLPTGVWTNWSVDSIQVPFVSGANKVRFTSVTSDGGPNIDKIDVTGMPGVILYELAINVIGAGQVEATTFATVIAESTIVDLTAVPDSGWQFLEWWGDAPGSSNPLSVLMNCDKDVTAVFITEFDSSYEFENTPIGFASVEALGQNGTSGGQGGDTTIVETGEDLFQILDDRRDPRFERNLQPLVLLVEGSLTWTDEAMMDLKENYDLSIIGNGGNARIIGFGLNIFRSYNIIIRNLEFRDAPDDCINVTDSLSHHIWIDHCTFSDSPDVDPNGDRHDGLLDIKHGASYITVSWNHFYNHQKTALLGHSDGNAEEDVDHLKVTYHHNWWDNTGSRHPRVRFGEVHVYNNYYDNTQQKMGYGIASTMEADVVAEANYFKMVPYPTHVGYGDSEEGDLLEFNNIYENSGTPEVRGTAFNPTAYYTYLVDDPMSLPALLMAYCGSGKLDSVSDEIDDVPRSYPAGFELSQNYPNPFNQTTRISFTLPEGGLLRLIIFDMAGKEVTQLVNETKNAGRHSVLFDASELSSGVYFYQIQSRGQLITRKMMLLK